MEHFICNNCGKEILEDKEDNFLGLNPDGCKHWYGSCFPGILKSETIKNNPKQMLLNNYYKGGTN